MGPCLLVTHEHMLDPALTFRDMERVVDRQNRPAGIPENGVDAMATQGIHQGLCTGGPAQLTRFLPADDRGSGRKGHGNSVGMDPQG